MVERHLAKVNVASSNLVFRSNFKLIASAMSFFLQIIPFDERGFTNMMQKILSYMRKAVDDYNMIEDGDKIAVGVSGGKDSLTLLAGMANLRRFYPKKFDIEAITLDLGYDTMDFAIVKKLCDELNVNYHVIPTHIKEVVFDIRKEENPCSLCAKMRRGALNNAALELGCKKVALGHHNEDVTETFMLSLFYESRINCFAPVTYLDRRQVYLIRPLIYTPETLIKSYAKKANLPIVENSCPADGNTQRQEIKDLLSDLGKKYPGLRDRIFGAVKRSSIPGWEETKIVKS